VGSSSRSKKHSRKSLSNGDAHTIPFSDSVAIRAYSDTRPHVGKISDLQKGLVLVCDGTETVGEGTGFGFPVLAYSHETYFSGTSKVRVSRGDGYWLVVKEFTMDRIPRNRFRNVRLENRKARTLIDQLSRLYQEQPLFRFLTLKKLTKKMQIRTSFVPANPVGIVAVTYKIRQQDIRVKADFHNVEKPGLSRVFILNEQGSTFFHRYVDSEGTELIDEGIGAWDRVAGEWGSLNCLENAFGFRLWKQDHSILRRGREYVKDSLDWTGLDYELAPSRTRFDYKIEVLGAC
jgi:hypothetical protein